MQKSDDVGVGLRDDPTETRRLLRAKEVRKEGRKEGGRCYMHARARNFSLLLRVVVVVVVFWQ